MGAQLPARQFALGRDVDWPDIQRRFEECNRVHILPNGKWHLTKFIGFQYGRLYRRMPAASPDSATR